MDSISNGHDFNLTFSSFNSPPSQFQLSAFSKLRPYNCDSTCSTSARSGFGCAGSPCAFSISCTVEK